MGLSLLLFTEGTCTVVGFFGDTWQETVGGEEAATFPGYHNETYDGLDCVKKQPEGQTSTGLPLGECVGMMCLLRVCRLDDQGALHMVGQIF